MHSILFRPSYDTEYELAVARKYFHISIHRNNVPKDSVVIGRYSVLPFYQELVLDLRPNGCNLVNSWVQHMWIASFLSWYDLLEEYTFKTWTDHDFFEAPEGEYVVKGATNSRKFRWDTHMYAPSKAKASAIAAELSQDELIAQQGIIYREYVPLETFETGLNGLPFTNEWRFFCYKNEIVAFDYYWSNADTYPKSCPFEIISLAKKIKDIVARHVNFYVMDIAMTKEGKPILVELNDGQMSGLSCIDPELFYKNLALLTNVGVAL